MKLRTKIQMYTTMMIVITLIIVNVFVYMTFKKNAIDSEVHQIENRAVNIIKELEKSQNHSGDNERIIVNHLLSDGSIAIIDHNNKRKIQIMTNKDYDSLVSKYSDKQMDRYVEHKGHYFVMVSVPVLWENDETVNLQIYENVDMKHESFETLKWILIGSTVMLTLIIFILNMIITHNILKPIHLLIDKMSNINKTKGYRKVEKLERSTKELDDLTDTFNFMMQRLSEQEEKEQSFIANASHELKTPITVIHSYSDMLKRFGKQKPELLDEGLDVIHEEAKRMKSLTNQMLQITSFQQKKQQSEMDIFDVTQVLRQLTKKFMLTYDRDIIIKGEEKPIYISASQEQLIQLFTIFIDNAMKYSDEVIVIQIGRVNQVIHIQIIDKGEGIPKESLNKIFDRFYRVDKARTRQSGGSGLGLYIAKEIAQQNQVDISMASTVGEGTTITLNIKEHVIE
ncbi:HAMP domain-containing histidine kinase [Staphylococcus sp. IVB6238]|uniref:sensor histidine kinase n=1 Tax=Staphylococcus sp. IVB6238 TaxID=2989770 RepID=UPI0021D1C932|nr:HAMP domain-containing sensor histidine kinase [Staphylococcus sp. IVB6238]UXR73548.1 HAMP domain-containing histidine kinase [Staphylococcus sp. IVB6238]